MSDKIKHLEFIQNIISRMATTSFILKGWNVTLISGLLALYVSRPSLLFVYISLFPAFAFWGLDAYYLRQERLFRKLYDSVRKNKKSTTSFSLNTHKVNDQVNPWKKVLFAPTIFGLHGVIVSLIIIIILIESNIITSLLGGI